MDELNQWYKVFGQPVMEQVQLELNRHGDLRELLTRLDEKVPETIDEQHEALKRLITRYGPLFFLTVAKSDWNREQIERIKGNLKSGVDTPLPGTLRRLTPTSAPSGVGQPIVGGQQIVVPPKEPPPTGPSEPRKIYPSERKPIVQYRSPYSAPSKNQPVHPMRRQADNGGEPRVDRRAPRPAQMVDTPTYKGPDRRTIPDRRVGDRDRRANVAMVYKNQRFGGRDRRKSVRREADRQKLRSEGS